MLQNQGNCLKDRKKTTTKTMVTNITKEHKYKDYGNNQTFKNLSTILAFAFEIF